MRTPPQICRHAESLTKSLKADAAAGVSGGLRRDYLREPMTMTSSIDDDSDNDDQRWGLKIIIY